MTHKERIAAIEKLQVASSNPTSRLFSRRDKQYLLNRVHALTEALEKIDNSVGHKDRCKHKEYPYCSAGCRIAEIASKALADGGNES